ncbi:ParB/RepB/Spo0J family partition protein [Deinococcus hopiensis]|uniref:Chromosome partitioning protein, ParB family n=1 Tax=Deinococcus hopiensis KR-140 TaxID=695939 RepID=A0A1W1VUL7_9DEIO|nr:ParB/RepB/Spo0J family partition protein [Deinococcus hopiensis]SMB97049.1 chromosome partitioning protein, ParB family [Deinococcus hopiensis KR-140]
MTRKRPVREDLSGLLGKSAELLQPKPATHTLPVAALHPTAAQPRRSFDGAGLASLAASLREQGVLQPLLVRPVEGGHEIVAGERRWRAAQLAGLTEVPVIIRELNDRESRAAALVENLQRENLNVIDEVDAKLDLVALTLDLPREEARPRLMQLLREAPGADHEAVSRLFGVFGETWEAFAKNKLRILKWPEAILGALRSGLPFTLAGVVAAAPEEHHADLLRLAQSGASRVELQAEVARLKAAAQLPAPHVHRAVQIGKQLSSRRLLTRLQPADVKALELWLDKMPQSVRQALEQSGG